MIPEQIQIGWYNPNSNRFCYMDEKDIFSYNRNDYTWPVYAIKLPQKKVLEIEKDKK